MTDSGQHMMRMLSCATITSRRTAGQGMAESLLAFARDVDGSDGESVRVGSLLHPPVSQIGYGMKDSGIRLPTLLIRMSMVECS